MTEDTIRLSERFISDIRFGRLLTLNMARKFISIEDAKRNKKFKFNGLEFGEISVASDFDNANIPITAYIPKGKTSKSAICLFFHGGGFKFMTRKSYFPTIGYLAESTNTIWLAVEYRLAPEHKHPIQFYDCLAATKYILKHKTSLFGSDECSKVGVCGDSAGGNLAACMAHELKNQLGFQVLIYPWLDLSCSSHTYDEFSDSCYFLNRKEMKQLVVDYLGKHKDPSSSRVSPLYNRDFQHQPKAFIILAELDPLVGEGKQYFQKLQNANIPSELHIIQGKIHGFFEMDEMRMKGFKLGAEHLISFLKRLE